MLFSAVTALALVGAVAQAAPAVKRDNIDTTILNYALTLEHLENAFYSGALAQFDAAAFKSAGFPSWVRGRISQVAEHEASHVALLSGALGSIATQPCSYKFPYTDVTSFLGLAAAIENVGVTAYLGAANKITDPTYLTVAGSILTVEARHQAWIQSAALKGAAWNGAYDAGLGFSQVYSIAANFITSCPSTNPTLPVTGFPAASISTSGYKAGDKVQLSFKTTGQTEYLVIYNGLTATANFINQDGTVTIPSNLQGQGYAYGVITTSSDASKVSDSNTVAGPIIMFFPSTSKDSAA